MNEPNILDRLFNVAVPDKDVKKWLDERAEALAAKQISFRAPAGVARRKISAELTKWINEHALTGRGTKKMVDKAVAKVMRTYAWRLHQRVKKSSSSDADRAITRDGRGRVSGWQRRRGERLAEKFQQKSR